MSENWKMPYQLAEIRIFAPDHETDQPDYPVELSVVGWRDFPRSALHLPLETLNTQRVDPHAYGRTLGEALFTEAALGQSYRDTLNWVRGRQEGLRVQLRLDTEALQTVQWELLFYPHDGQWLPLGAQAETPFCRYLPAQSWKRLEAVDDEQLRILVIVASPSDLNSYELDPIPQPEQRALQAIFADNPKLKADFLVTGTDRPPTLVEITRALSRGYHLIHFHCHGARTPQGTVLYLEDAVGGVDPVSAQRLITAMGSVGEPPLLCFLAACESAARSRHDGFLPMGPGLIDQGAARAVIAMTDKVGMTTAFNFADQFYTRLTGHGLVDLAVNEARSLIRERWDWGTPVLLTHASDGTLWRRPDLSIQEATIPTPQPARVEKLRNLEAAMPSQARVGRRTEVRVMVALPESMGLARYLPDFTESGELITKEDVSENDVAIDFPVDPVTGQELPTQLYIQLMTADFTVEQTVKILHIPPHHDSGVVTFFLTPIQAGELARLSVELYQDANCTILLTSLSLDCTVSEARDPLLKSWWRKIRLPFGMAGRIEEVEVLIPKLPAQPFAPHPILEAAPAFDESMPSPSPAPQPMPDPMPDFAPPPMPTVGTGPVGCLGVVLSLALLIMLVLFWLN